MGFGYKTAVDADHGDMDAEGRPVVVQPPGRVRVRRARETDFHRSNDRMPSYGRALFEAGRTLGHDVAMTSPSALVDLVVDQVEAFERKADLVLARYEPGRQVFVASFIDPEIGFRMFIGNDPKLEETWHWPGPEVVDGQADGIMLLDSMWRSRPHWTNPSDESWLAAYKTVVAAHLEIVRRISQHREVTVLNEPVASRTPDGGALLQVENSIALAARWEASLLREQEADDAAARVVASDTTLFAFASTYPRVDPADFARTFRSAEDAGHGRAAILRALKDIGCPPRHGGPSSETVRRGSRIFHYASHDIERAVVDLEDALDVRRPGWREEPGTEPATSAPGP